MESQPESAEPELEQELAELIETTLKLEYELEMVISQK